MFNTIWRNIRRYSKEKHIQSGKSQLNLKIVKSVALLHWEEHCLECVPPECYRSCMNFKARIDQKCIRMAYGFIENPDFSGLFSYGIDCRFEPWAKIECRFNPIGYDISKIRHLDYFSRGLSQGIMRLAKLFRFLSPKLKLTGAVNLIRDRFFLIMGKGLEPKFNAFVLECYSAETETFRLQLQCDYKGRVLYRYAFKIIPGHNYFEIPFKKFNLSSLNWKARIFIYPENNRTCRLIFTWLDFVRYITKQNRNTRPSEKVKCVAWDLDNTIWKGILIEDGSREIRLNEVAIDTIRELDRRGIVHTIVSKNTYEEAWIILENFGISEYFIYSAINWGAKSENLKSLASRINIGLDTFAFVDDSPHERSEVAFQLPMVRIYSEKQITKLTTLPEFDIPITEMSSKRRLSYLSQMKREKIKEKFGNNYESFLRTLEMRMEIFQPLTETEKKRCLELLKRSNQLNLSTHRYTQEEFISLLTSENVLCYAFRCWDKFGDYGTVGFVSIILGNIPKIKDLVISCRIAQKHYEHSLIYWVSQKLKKNGYQELYAKLIKTKRNTPLQIMFQSLPFNVIEDNNEFVLYKLPDLSLNKDEKIIKVTFRDKESIDENHN